MRIRFGDLIGAALSWLAGVVVGLILLFFTLMFE